ncbi:hypothetical protein ADK67_17445 [Saccharothrix sp. NRRL B-16348]|nr:hypothetical protein ADK67_17445 [Saccharothrix sp. NRRL B-16348]
MGAGAGTSMKLDQVALLAAALAAVLSTSSAEGAWEPFECVVGGVLLLIVFAFHDFAVARQNRRARAAVAGVLALLWCLALAWPVQEFVARDESHVPGLLTGLWVVLFGAHVAYLSRQVGSRRGDRNVKDRKDQKSPRRTGRSAG